MVLWLLAACLSESVPPAAPSCGACHGSEANPAPPSALGGITDPTYIGVGAHQAHVVPGDTSKGMGCGECHPFPETLDAEGHIDTPWPAEVAWGTVAKTDGRAEPWDREAGTCTVWCHGTDAPAWVQGTAGCGTCHGLPPEAPHPQLDDCGLCHPAISQETHIDGTVQLLGSTPTTPTGTDTGPPTGPTAATGDTDDTGTVIPQGCGDCHGSASNPAPPPDTSGNVDPTVPTVGAHQVHTEGTDLADAIPCTTCHVVPATVDAPGHLDAAPAEVVFSGLAVAGGANPVYDGLSCTNTYCHTGPGGQIPSPEWTDADMPRSCRNCHDSPPPDPHPASSSCEGCHSSVAGPNFTIVDPTKHIDGTLDF